MRIPQQVSERMKEAPAQVLRAVFSGIGQVLLVADRIRNSRSDDPARARRAEPKEETRWRSLDETGNVRLLSEDDAAGHAEPTADTPARAAAHETPAPASPAARRTAAPAESAAPPAAARPAVPSAAHGPGTAAGAGAGDGQAALPVPDYDDRTVASLRARLRSLDSAQVQALLDYERAHAGRDDVLTMYERRIAKLQGGQA